MEHTFWRYFWWIRFPVYWWKNWRYDPSKEVPFKPGELNYIRGWNEDPPVHARFYYKADEPPGDFLLAIIDDDGNKMNLDRIWCAGFPPIRPSRPMPKGTVAYGGT